MEWKALTRSCSPLIRRIAWLCACGAAFMVMASVFTPDRLRAGSDTESLRGIPPRSVDAVPQTGSLQNPEQNDSELPQTDSVDPHEGLLSLGVIEDKNFVVRIYATGVGPRYTVCDRQTGRELGALLSLDQVHRNFPDLQLPDMELAPSSGTSSLLLADTPHNQW